MHRAFVASLALSSLPLFASSAPVGEQAVESARSHGRQEQALLLETLSSTASLSDIANSVSAPALAEPATSSVSEAAPAADSPVLFFPPVAAVPAVMPFTDPPVDADTAEAPPAGPLMMAYYPDWVGATFPPEKIDFTRFDWVDFAFAIPDGTFNLTWDEPTESPALLSRLVNVAHLNGKKVKLSIGGWDGSQYFSSAVATDQSRQTFTSNILAIYQAYNIDGIDIDWEYPSQQGAGNNEVSPDDTPNFLAFLKLLRNVLPASARITAAAQTQPFADAQGNPMQNVSSFSTALDWVLLMNYDVWGSSSNPGPNAPLYDGCHNSTQPGASALAAYKSWTAAGFPASKLVLGLPSYGYVSESAATHLRQRRDRRWRRSLRKRDVAVESDDGTTDSGQVQFQELVSQGALVPTNVTTPTGAAFYAGASGFTRYWDFCSSTPFLRSSAADEVITFDDPQSLSVKAMFAKDVGLLGVNMFDVHGDTGQWDLVDAVRRGLQLD